MGFIGKEKSFYDKDVAKSLKAKLIQNRISTYKRFGTFDSYCILLPQFIDDILLKMNNRSIFCPRGARGITGPEDNGKFINGYAVIKCNRNISYIIREDGSIIDNLPPNIESAQPFFDDMLVGSIDGKCCFINGLTGKVQYLSLEYESFPTYMASFHDGYIKVLKSGKWYYLDKNLNECSNGYTYASNFIDNKALVCVDDNWQIINGNFDLLENFSNNTDKNDLFLQAIKNIDDFTNSIKTSSKVKTKFDANHITYYDIDTGFSIFLPHMIESISICLGIEMPQQMALKEKIIYLVNEASKRGVYAFDIHNYELIKLDLEDTLLINEPIDGVYALLRQKIKGGI